jgi:bzd-type benzoyl-CoA reductase N subunit
MSVLQELTVLSRDAPGATIQDWKGSGKKVVGFFCSYVPEEILYAADILPFRMRATTCTDTAMADVYMSHLNCTFMRSCLQFVLEGRYEFLDGIVFTNSCDHVRRVYDILREIRPADFPLAHFLSVPHKVGDEAALWYRDELEQFRTQVQQCFGVEVTDGRLAEAIDVYNETRSLLKGMYQLRQRESPPLTGAQSLSVVLAAGRVPRTQYNRLLGRLLEELSDTEGIPGYRARLMIAGGGGCDDPDYLQVMEDLGALVVTDSLCFGSRYFWEPVNTEEDLMLGLARSYLNRPSCPGMVDTVAERGRYLKEMVSSFRVDGIVFQRIRYCDLWGGQLLYLPRELKQAGIPLLSLEREYRLSATGQLRTRVQAFLESLEGR